MTQPPQFSIRDSYGNTYGPASVDLLRQWIREGRIIAGMQIAPEGTENWIEVSTHPGLADLFVNPASPAPQLVPVPGPRLATPSPTPTFSTPATPVELAYHSSPARTQPLAIVSLVTGILSLFSCCCPIGVALGLAALITGIFGAREIKARPDLYTGMPLAITGIVLGSIAMLIQLAYWGVVIVNIIVNASR